MPDSDIAMKTASNLESVMVVEGSNIDDNEEEHLSAPGEQRSVIDNSLSRLSESLWSLRCLFEHTDEEHEAGETPERNEEFVTFLSENSDVRNDILALLDEFEAMESLCVSPDPDVEGVFVGLVDEVVNTSFQMTDMIGRGWQAGSFTARSIDKVGGPGTMARVWELLKELRGVVGGNGSWVRLTGRTRLAALDCH